MRSWLSSRVVDLAWVLVLGLFSSSWCLGAGKEVGPTFDEPFYLKGGLHFWRTGSFESLLKLGTMPLPMVVGTAPVRAWEVLRGEPVDLDREFDPALALARPATLLFWWPLLVYGYLAGSRLAGRWGGRLSVALLACEPTLLGHASLATTDVALTACLLAFAFHFQTGRESGWWGRVGLCAALYALALLAKASALAYGVLVMVTLEYVRLWGLQPAEAGLLARARSCLASLFARPFRRDVTQVVGLGLALTFLACWSDWKASPSFVAWAESLPPMPFGRGMVWVAEHLTIFSNAGVAIVRQVRHNMQGHGAYLLGTTSPRALWYYFPVALTIKLALPMLLLPAALAVVSPRSLRNRVLALALVFLVFSLNCRVQIGIRLVMPIVVFAAIGLGAALGDAFARLGPGWRRRLVAFFAGTGVAWVAASAALVWPHGLCYVNELWGGTGRGYECVSGSDYDWGQGVRELDRWREHHGRSVSLLYYGTDPVARSDHFTALTVNQLPGPDPDQIRAATGGRDLAVSVSLLYGPRHKHDRLNALLDYLRAQPPAERTRFFVIYRFPAAEDGGANARAGR